MANTSSNNTSSKQFFNNQAPKINHHITETIPRRTSPNNIKRTLTKQFRDDQFRDDHHLKISSTYYQNNPATTKPQQYLAHIIQTILQRPSPKNIKKRTLTKYYRDDQALKNIKHYITINNKEINLIY